MGVTSEFVGVDYESAPVKHNFKYDIQVGLLRRLEYPSAQCPVPPLSIPRAYTHAHTTSDQHHSQCKHTRKHAPACRTHSRARAVTLALHVASCNAASCNVRSCNVASCNVASCNVSVPLVAAARLPPLVVETIDLYRSWVPCCA